MRQLLALLLALAAPAFAQTAPPPPPAGVVTGRFVLPDRPPWAGEVFALRFVWQVNWDIFRYLEGDLAWTADPLVTEGWTREPLATPRPQGDRMVADLGFATRAVALTSGTIALKPASQTMQIATGSYETSGVTIATIGPVLARSAPQSIRIRPLPPPPPGFSGAVGDFSLQSSLGSARIAVGKPVAWTLTLSGTGNWMGFPGVPARPLPRAFDTVGAPEPAPAPGAGLFERSIAETITIVPSRAGRFTLGPVTMTVFDPVAGRYHRIIAPAVVLVVEPGAAAAPAAGQRPPATPERSAGLPPPLPGIGHARPPLPHWAWVAVLASAPVGMALLWLGLATRRALLTDPDRPARRADARLRRTIAALAAAPAPATARALLRDWQCDAGVRLGLDHAAPTPASVGRADWAQLWAEADRRLYAVNADLPADWPARAAAVLARTAEPRRFAARRIFTASNLYPVAAALCLVLVAVPNPLSANDKPAADAVAPLDWIGHYNRGRAAALAGDWPLAAAHAGIAWVQAPRSADTTALWRRAAREAGVGGRSSGGLPLPDDARGRFTGLLPPSGWQLLTGAAALLILGGFGTLLLIRFGLVPRRARAAGLAIAAIGALGAAIGGAGVAGYGPAASPDAAVTLRRAVLRPLPVDTPEAEATIIVAAGTVGHRDGDFIGWSRLTLADGRSGWVRRGELLPVW